MGYVGLVLALVYLQGTDAPIHPHRELPIVVSEQAGPVSISHPVSVAAGQMLVVDAHLTDPGQPGWCQHVAVPWEGYLYSGYRVDDNTRRVLIPIALDTPASRQRLNLVCDGARFGFEQIIEELEPALTPSRRRRRRGRVSLPVARRFGEPPKHRVLREGRRMARAFRSTSPDRLWTRQFMRPAAGVETSPFGTKRKFHGKTSVHKGLDINGDRRDFVYAANDGRVVLVADNFFYVGNAVVIDHGRGLLTLYLHLSRTAVAKGQLVERGDLVGTIGATGRVTGPHLHFAVRFNGVYVDPVQLLHFVPERALPAALAGAMLTPDRSSGLALTGF